MSDYTRKAKRNRIRREGFKYYLSHDKGVNKKKVPFEGKMVCPYNHQECDERTCNSCLIAEESEE